MGITISLILAIITLIYNILRRNKVGVNLLAIMVPVIISGLTIGFAMQTTSFYVVNTIYTALSLILSVLAILLIIKNMKSVKWTKSILLIPIVLSYVYIHILTNTIDSVSFWTTYESLRDSAIFTLGITLLVIFQINLFINLISNTVNTKKESDSKLKKKKKEKEKVQK